MSWILYGGGRGNLWYNLRKSLKRIEKSKEIVDRGMLSTSQKVALINHYAHCMPLLWTHACYMSRPLHPSWVHNPYKFSWFIQTKISAYSLGCILVHFGTQLITVVIETSCTLRLIPTLHPISRKFLRSFTHVTCIREVPGLNLGCNTNIPECGFPLSSVLAACNSHKKTVSRCHILYVHG